MKKYKYSFAPDKNSKNGIAATVIGAISLGLLFLAVIISFALGGKATNAVGAIGMFSFMLSIYGFIIGIRSLQEKSANHRFSVIGSIASGVMSVIWLAVFFGGLK